MIHEVSPNAEHDCIEIEFAPERDGGPRQIIRLGAIGGRSTPPERVLAAATAMIAASVAAAHSSIRLWNGEIVQLDPARIVGARLVFAEGKAVRA